MRLEDLHGRSTQQARLPSPATVEAHAVTPAPAGSTSSTTGLLAGSPEVEGSADRDECSKITVRMADEFVGEMPSSTGPRLALATSSHRQLSKSGRTVSVPYWLAVLACRTGLPPTTPAYARHRAVACPAGAAWPTAPHGPRKDGSGRAAVGSPAHGYRRLLAQIDARSATQSAS
jgi:hypothetical protein